MIKNNNIIRSNFRYPTISETDFHFGSGKIVGTVLRENGDWRDYLPLEEAQSRAWLEPSSCYVSAQQNAIATILEEQFGIKDSNFSARFNCIFANGTPSGGDPLVGAQTFRDYGLIPEELLPFNENIYTWQEFVSFKYANKNVCLSSGKGFKGAWELNYDIVSTREEPLDVKFKKLKEALKYSPICLSVWGETDANGNYVPKQQGIHDTHFVEAVYVDDENRIWIRDTYAPYDKKLPANYPFDFAMRHSVSKKNTVNEQATVINRLISLIRELISKLK